MSHRKLSSWQDKLASKVVSSSHRSERRAGYSQEGEIERGVTRNNCERLEFIRSE